MRALIQRVKQAQVLLGDKAVSSIGPGLLIFLGVCKDDETCDADRLAQKIPTLRIFDDPQGKMNVGALDCNAAFLVVSQFTLHAKCWEGRRPGFDDAAGAAKARELYEYFLQRLSAVCPAVQAGVFGALMQVNLVNDGPVTLWMDTRNP